MNGSVARFFRFGAGLLVLVTLGWVLAGQAAKPAHHRVPLVTDWSHRHVIFSQPRTAEEAARLQLDPRFEQQVARRSQRLVLANGEAERSFGAATAQPAAKHFLKMRRDWSADLGAGGSVGAGFFPAKFSFDIEHASCADDFVVFATGLASSGSQASIVAYTNLYSGCGGTVPSVYWAYNTQGTAITSPVFSRDGSQLAFVETQGGIAGELVLIKWKSAPGSSVGSPAATSFQNTGAQYLACTAPCWTTVDLRDSGGSFFKNTTSSVFYDYTNDIAWVGGDTGWLEKITGVFNGAPTEVHDAIWPKQLNPGTPTALNSPVFDHTSGNVFVGDAGGFLYSVNSTTGAVTKSGQLDFGVGLGESPILDLTNHVVFAFASSDGSLLCGAGSAPCAAVYQLPTNFAATATGTKVTVGDSSATPNPMYTGGFDNSYFTSINGTGNLYVCGNTGAEPMLYQIPIAAGAFTAAAGAPITQLGSAGQTSGCSPVSDIANPNTNGGPSERVFVSVQNHGITGSCSGGGCLFNFVDAPWQASTTYAVGQQILDSNLHIETVIVAGTSGTSAPAWGGTAGGVKPDGIGTLVWVDQGFLTASNLAAWAALTPFAGNARIRDSNGNVEVINVDGISGALEPTWSTTAGGFTVDGTIVWVNAGPSPSTLKASGGTSGIIIDNVVSPTTLLGVSQIYFSTLSDQVCNDGTGGCAVQASQPGLN